MCGNFVFACLSRGFVEEVGEVEEEDGACGVGAVDVAVYLGLDGVEDELEAALGGDAHLAEGEEVGDDFLSEDFHDAGANDAS